MIWQTHIFAAAIKMHVQFRDWIVSESVLHWQPNTKD